MFIMFEPIPSKYRPETLDEFIGQKHLAANGMPIRNFIESGNIPSMIFWGPPGTGKTTLANIISKSVNANFHKLSAVMSGKSTLMEIIGEAVAETKDNKLFEPKKTVLFLDEIHRWN
ncbi:partial Replication-associated recombination protein A, partial [Patescibacteria group bacterium]